MKKKSSKSKIIRSSSAEYLTFISASGENQKGVEMRYEDENIWMTQKMMAELYNVSISAINQHLNKLTSDNEIDLATIKKYLIVQKEGNREVKRSIEHYNLQTIISVLKKLSPIKMTLSRYILR